MTEQSTGWKGQNDLYRVIADGYPEAWQWDERWSDRQERIAGFDQQKIEQSCVLVVGCGGIGRPASEIVNRKGTGEIRIVDPDTVSLTDLHRTLWSPDSVGEFKAIAAVRELAPVSPRQTELVGFPGTLEEVLAGHPEMLEGVTACLVGIDNDTGRVAACTLQDKGIPVVFYAVSPDTYTVEVFVQEPDGPCWACVHPDRYEAALAGQTHPGCPRTPAIADPAMVAVGLCCYALDSIVMGRPRAWNLWQSHLHGEVLPRITHVVRSSECPHCAPGASDSKWQD